MVELNNLFGLAGKNVVITGAGSGMGLAATKLLVKLGANVYATTRSKPLTFDVTKEIKVDLSQKEELDRLITELPETIDALFICHGISDSVGHTNAKLVQMTNFYSFKYLTEHLLPRIPKEGSVTFITSNGGKGWRAQFDKCVEVINCATWEDAEKWYDENPDYTTQGYTFAKECQHAFIMTKAAEFAKMHKRINGVAPGYTITGLSDTFNKSLNGDAEFGKKIIEQIYLGSWDGRAAMPEEMGHPLVALGSKIGSYINGQIIYIDYGNETEWQLAQIQNGELLGKK